MEQDVWHKSTFGFPNYQACSPANASIRLWQDSPYFFVYRDICSGVGFSASSKAGLIRFVESVSKEVKDYDLTVNCVLPSIIDTKSNRKMMPDANFRNGLP